MQALQIMNVLEVLNPHQTNTHLDSNAKWSNNLYIIFFKSFTYVHKYREHIQGEASNLV